MDFQAYNKILICQKNICNKRAGDVITGYEFEIKYPSYRGVFLSCIEDLWFEIDGSRIENSAVTFRLNGKDFLLSELSECYKEYWFVRTSAVIHIADPNGIAPGAHTVRVFMKHRVPYTGYFGEYLVLDSDVTATLNA